MINKKLLNEELDDYKIRMKVELKPVKYNRNLIFNLFRKYKNYSMTENSYDCYGEEECCWQELIEEGNWNLTLKSVRASILGTFKEIRYYLCNRRNLGNRLYMYKDKNCCYIYIYLRDVIKTDYHIWFDNNKN